MENAFHRVIQNCKVLISVAELDILVMYTLAVKT